MADLGNYIHRLISPPAPFHTVYIHTSTIICCLHPHQHHSMLSTSVPVLLYVVYITANTVPHHLCPCQYHYTPSTSLLVLFCIIYIPASTVTCHLQHYRYCCALSILLLVSFHELHLLPSPSSLPLTDVHIQSTCSGHGLTIQRYHTHNR
jgi:hypothetical protein